MEAASGAYLHRPGDGELRRMGETFTYFLATGDQTGGTFTLVDEEAKRGESVPLHLHQADMESFYVVDGEITFYIGEQSGDSSASRFVRAPTRWNRPRLSDRIGNGPIPDPDNATSRAVLPLDHLAFATRRLAASSRSTERRSNGLAKSTASNSSGHYPTRTEAAALPHTPDAIALPCASVRGHPSRKPSIPVLSKRCSPPVVLGRREDAVPRPKVVPWESSVESTCTSVWEDVYESRCPLRPHGPDEGQVRLDDREDQGRGGVFPQTDLNTTSVSGVTAISRSARFGTRRRSWKSSGSG